MRPLLFRTFALAAARVAMLLAPFPVVALERTPEHPGEEHSVGRSGDVVSAGDPEFTTDTATAAAASKTRDRPSVIGLIGKALSRRWYFP